MTTYQSANKHGLTKRATLTHCHLGGFPGNILDLLVIVILLLLLLLLLLLDANETSFSLTPEDNFR